MTDAREVFLTQEDEIAVSVALVTEFPHVHFWNGWYWDEPEALTHDTLAHCIHDLVRVSISPDPWFPEFERTPDGSAFYLANDLLYLLIERSWRPDLTMSYTWEKDGRPAEVRKGSIQVLAPGKSEEKLELTRRVWRALDRAMSNDLIHVAAPSGGVLYAGGGPPHPYYVGHNAILWAAAAPQRVFEYIPRGDLGPDRGWGCYPHARAIAEARAATERLPVNLDAEAKVAVWQRADATPDKDDFDGRLRHVRNLGPHRVTGEELATECVVGPETGATHAAFPDSTFCDAVTGKKIRLQNVLLRKDGETPVAVYRRQLARLRDNLGAGGGVVAMPRLGRDQDPDDEIWQAKVGAGWTEAFTHLFGPPPGDPK